MARDARAFVVLPGEGTAVQGPVGGPAIIKARTENTAGTFAAVEMTIPPREGPPLHVHAREDEMWYVLGGDFRFRADERILLGPEGSFVFVPRGTAHCFQNISDRPGRVLVMFTPAGMERFFVKHAELHSPVDPEEYARIAHESGMEVLGPPLAVWDPLPGS